MVADAVTEHINLWHAVFNCCHGDGPWLPSKLPIVAPGVARGF
jgi:hypothetical protein